MKPISSKNALPRQRSPLLVLLLAILTCGLYLIYWYQCYYEDWEALTGKTPTGNVFLLDFIFSLLTAGIWGIYVDYKISQELLLYQRENNLTERDTGLIIVILDIASYLTVFITFFISSAIQQDLLNDLRKSLKETKSPEPGYASSGGGFARDVSSDSDSSPY